MNWTQDQQAAIFSRGQNLLLSAAAGSGKTTVLVERALALMDEGAEIDSFLIVTFSRAAAADMKRKLTDELTDRASADPRFVKQLEKIERASVSTIHSFCADLLREHFESAGVDPMFRIMDSPELAQMEAQALSETMEAFYAEGGADLDALTYGRSADQVRKLASELHRFSLESPEPESWLKTACIDLIESDGSVWFSELVRSARASLRDAGAQAAYALTLCADPEGPSAYIPALSGDLEALQGMLAAPDYAALSQAVSSFSPARLGAVRKPKDGPSERLEALKEQVKALRQSVKKLIDRVCDQLMDAKSALADMQMLAPSMRALGGIAAQMGRRLDELKAEHSALSYSDLEHKALEALRNERVAASVRVRYQHVFVDEYQDVSAVQESILRKIADPGSLFMVGDVKQSIYRFRQAEPSLFLEKYRRYGKDEGGCLVSLKQNFRSRPDILSFVNRVFERVMTGGDAEIEYDDAARLRPGAVFEGGDPPIELHILEKSSVDESLPEAELELTGAEREGALIAERIISLIGTPYFDARKKCVRPLEYRDFVVLVRTNAPISAIESMLSRAGIPAYADVVGGYFGALEVALALSLLHVIDNRRRDLDLIAALRSPVCALSSSELAAIRKHHPTGSFRDAMLEQIHKEDALGVRLRAFEEKLDRWRELSRALPLGRLIDLILMESGFYAYVGGMPGGAGRQANLDLLCDYANNYETAQAGALSGFLDYIREIKQGGDDMGAAHTLGEEDQVVRIMTIHKSKGLEFPVVLAAQMGRRLSRSGPRGEFFAHRALGAAIRLNDPSLGTTRDTLARAAIGARLEREEYNEEMRVLYVLLTRPIDRLIMVGQAGSADARTRFRLCGQSGLRPMSYLETVEPSAEELGARIEWHVGVLPDTAAQSESAQAPEPQADAELRAALLWRYPHEVRVMMPLKLTVSGLARDMVGPKALPPLGKRPLFMTEEGPRAAEYGTLTHNALMALDLKPLAALSHDALTAEIARQLALLSATGRLYGEVDPALIAGFFERPVGRRMLRANRIEREWPFNLRVGDREDRILVQGVIDCCFIEDGEWVLLDYKTDRTTDRAALVEHYRPQIEWYAKALKKITGIPVRERLICLLRAGEELSV